jgi:phospholipase C
MLPGLVSQSNKPRSEAIGKLLAASDYDVVVFQEAFCPIARRQIRQLLAKSYPYQAGPANRRMLSLKVNSGIWIFSKYPILSDEEMIFTERTGWDAFSRKGALLVEINVNGSPIQIVGTHLQNAGDDKIRRAQCSEVFRKLLLPNKKIGTPQLICGDFNINKYKSGESYQMMLDVLEATDGEPTSNQKFSYDRLNNDLHVEKGTNQDLIDYILIRDNGAWVDCLHRDVIALRSQWDPDHQDLSDHYSMAIEINYSNQPVLSHVVGVR